MKRFVAVGAITLLVALGLLIALWRYRTPNHITLDTPYQAVLLDNGQVFYGKLEQLDSDFPVLTEVYYIQHQVNTQTKEEKNILIRRGNEWHSPNRTVLNRRHIVMIEPVAPGSKVAELIAALKAKGQ
ncbi:MAG: hypothetical protein WB992_17580 [Bryobacteraceae bacterium]